MHRVSKTQQSNTNTIKSKKIKDIKNVLEVSNLQQEQYKEFKFQKQQEEVLDKQIQFTEQPDVEQAFITEPKILQNAYKNPKYIDVNKYEKISSIELDKYSNDDLASVLFIRFRKDDNPLAKLALEIHRTIINVKNKDFSKQTTQNLQTEQRNYKRKPRNIMSDTIVKPPNAKDIVVSIR